MQNTIKVQQSSAQGVYKCMKFINQQCVYFLEISIVLKQGHMHINIYDHRIEPSKRISPTDVPIHC